MKSQDPSPLLSDYSTLEDGNGQERANDSQKSRVANVFILAMISLIGAACLLQIQGANLASSSKVSDPLELLGSKGQQVQHVQHVQHVKHVNGTAGKDEVESLNVVREEHAIESEEVLLIPDRCPHSTYANLLDYREFLEGSDSEFYPFLSSVGFKQHNPHLKYAIIWIHGFSGKADEYFCDAEKFVNEIGPGVSESTINIAPWFGAKAEFPGHLWHGKLTPEQKMKVWGPVSWITGEVGAKADAKKRNLHLTSFELVDTLVAVLRNRTLYPNLETITISGFSAGCQFASRYAFFSLSPLPAPGKAEVQIIAANCGSYMYLDERRPAKNCRADFDTGSGHTCEEFSVPEMKHAIRNYNKYKLGLEQTMYSDLALEYIKMVFPQKKVRFLLGDQDVCNCNSVSYHNPEFCAHIAKCSPSLTHGQCCDTFPDNTVLNVFDNKSESMTQGSNRFQRGLNYMYYLRKYYDTDSFPEFDIFHGGHDMRAFSRDLKFIEWSFGKQVAWQHKQKISSEHQSEHRG